MSTVSSVQAEYITAPPGFTAEQWETFEQDGIIFLEDALSPAEVTRYSDALDRIAAADDRFDPGETFGRENVVELDPALAELIAREQPFVTAVLRRGYPVEEITYPFADGDASALFRGKRKRADPLPWVLVSTLPRLDSKPDSLFDRMMEFVGSLPEQPPREHYLALFAWLCSRFDRRFWIERSGRWRERLAESAPGWP